MVIDKNNLQFRKWRIDNRYSMSAMANLLGVNRYSYRNYEVGTTLLPLTVLIRFLRLRGNEKDSTTIEVLEAFYGREK